MLSQFSSLGKERLYSFVELFRNAIDNPRIIHSSFVSEKGIFLPFHRTSIIGVNSIRERTREELEVKPKVFAFFTKSSRIRRQVERTDSIRLVSKKRLVENNYWNKKIELLGKPARSCNCFSFMSPNEETRGTINSISLYPRGAKVVITSTLSFPPRYRSPN